MNDFQPIFRGEVFLSNMQGSNHEIEAKGLHAGHAGESALDTQLLLFSPRQVTSLKFPQNTMSKVLASILFLS